MALIGGWHAACAMVLHRTKEHHERHAAAIPSDIH